jgi:hypothetical protein
MREKVCPMLSSPSQRKWDTFERGTKSVLYNAEMTDYENLAIRQQQLKQEKKGGSNKRKLRKGGAITVQEARRLKAEKAEKRVKEDMEKVMSKQRREFNAGKNKAQKRGIEWRRRDKANKEAAKKGEHRPVL